MQVTEDLSDLTAQVDRLVFGEVPAARHQGLQRLPFHVLLYGIEAGVVVG